MRKTFNISQVITVVNKCTIVVDDEEPIRHTIFRSEEDRQAFLEDPETFINENDIRFDLPWNEDDILNADPIEVEEC